MTIDISNYRIIEKAHVDVDGITVIRGQNDSGKSCLMRALRTAIDNSSSDEQIRYGAKSFTVGIALAGRSLSFSRARKGSPLLSFDNGRPIEKIGRLAISEIDPSFPLKTLRLSDGSAEGTDRFLPNFVFQGETPIFGQVNIYSFFSAMFDPVARLSRHLLTVRKRVSDAESQANAGKARVDALQEASVSIQTQLAEIDQVRLTESYLKVQQGLKLQEAYFAEQLKLAGVEGQLTLLGKFRCLAGVDFHALSERHALATKLLELHAKRAALLEKREQLAARFQSAAWAEERVPRLQGMLSYAGTLQTVTGLMGERKALPSRESLQTSLNLASYCEIHMHTLTMLKVTAETTASLVKLLQQRTSITTRQATYVRRRDHIASRVEPLLPLMTAAVASHGHRQKLAALRYTAQQAEKTIIECRAQLLDVKNCPVCNNPLEHSLEHYVRSLA